MTETAIRPTTKVTIGEKEYSLRFTHRDFSVAEFLIKQQEWPNIHMLGPQATEFWKNFDAIEHAVIGGKKVDAFAPSQFHVGVLLYVGLIHTDRSMLLEDALQMLTFANAGDLGVVLFQAATQGITGLTLEEAAAGQEASDERPLPAGNGGDSDGQSPAKTSDSAPGQSPETSTTSSGTSPQPSSTPSTSDI